LEDSESVSNVGMKMFFVVVAENNLLFK